MRLANTINGGSADRDTPDMTRAVALNANPETPSHHDLIARYGDLGAEDLLRVAITEIFPGAIALVSSFGAESSVLLHMASRVDAAIPVIFLDTGKLFGETLRYRDALATELGLSDIRSIRPRDDEVAKQDHNGLLWTRDTAACCALRKVRPLSWAVAGFDAWITGRKRFQSEDRGALDVFENGGGHIKINPLAAWGARELDDYMTAHDLPRHPLVGAGYPSIGCMPCTRRIRVGEPYRAGRWAGLDKTECGIHIGEGI